MRGSSGFAKFLCLVSGLFIIFSVLTLISFGILELSPQIGINDLSGLLAISQVYGFLFFVSFSILFPIQIVLMVGVFLLQLRRLGEYGIFYLTSFIGLGLFLLNVILGLGSIGQIQ